MLSLIFLYIPLYSLLGALYSPLNGLYSFCECQDSCGRSLKETRSESISWTFPGISERSKLQENITRYIKIYQNILTYMFCIHVFIFFCFYMFVQVLYFFDRGTQARDRCQRACRSQQKSVQQVLYKFLQVWVQGMVKGMYTVFKVFQKFCSPLPFQ